MAQELNFYSRLYDNFFDDEMCDAYVDSFEETMKKDAEEVKKTSICTGPIRPDGHYSFLFVPLCPFVSTKQQAPTSLLT